MTYFQLLTLTAAMLAQQADSAKPITLDSAQITLIDEVELAVREAGQIIGMPVKEGQIVAEDELVAQIDDTEPQLLRSRTQVEAAIAERQASNDVKVRFAKKSHEVAEAELRRAKESVEKFAKSVSNTELDRLRLAAQRTLLEVEQSEHDQEIAALTHKLKQTEVEVATRGIERRKVVSPLAGMVVELKRRRGEWVQPGDVVVRLVRIDRVRAEGFVPAAEITGDLLGAPVTLRIDLPGKPNAEFEGSLAFISPEVNPVNGQVRVWAEIENKDLALRPGLQARLEIQKSGEKNKFSGTDNSKALNSAP